MLGRPLLVPGWGRDVFIVNVTRWGNFAALSNMVEEALKMRPYCKMHMFLMIFCVSEGIHKMSEICKKS